MHFYLLDVGYELPEYVHIVPRETIPLVVVVVVLGLYVPVLSGNVGGVDIVICSCQSLVILSVHMSIVLYYLHSTTAYIEFACNARSIDDRICVRTYSMYVHAYSTNAYVDICLKRIYVYICIYEYHCELCMHASLPPSSFPLHCPSGKQTSAGLMLGPLAAHTFTL